MERFGFHGQLIGNSEVWRAPALIKLGMRGKSAAKFAMNTRAAAQRDYVV